MIHQLVVSASLQRSGQQWLGSHISNSLNTVNLIKAYSWCQFKCSLTDNWLRSKDWCHLSMLLAFNCLEKYISLHTQYIEKRTFSCLFWVCVFSKAQSLQMFFSSAGEDEEPSKLGSDSFMKLKTSWNMWETADAYNICVCLYVSVFNSVCMCFTVRYNSPLIIK